MEIANPGEKPGKPVEVVRVAEADMEAQVFVNGRIQSKATRSVTADAVGKVLTVPVAAGDHVQAGDVLCTLDPEDLRYLIEQKQIQVEQQRYQASVAGGGGNAALKSKLELAVAGEEKARKDYEARKALEATGAVSASELEDYAYRHRQALDELQAAQASYDSKEQATNAGYQLRLQESELKKLEADLEKKTLRAPIDGVVTEVNVKPQDMTTVEGPLFVIEDTAHLEAITQISEFDISKVKVGQEAILKPTGLKGVSLRGIVSQVAPTARLQTTGQTRETVVEVKVDVTDPVPELRSNFSTDIIIRSEAREKALVLPYEALYISPEGTRQVFVVADGVLQIKPVQTGIEGDLTLEVAFDGIRKDLEVVLNPTDALKEGDRVKVMNPEEAGDAK